MKGTSQPLPLTEDKLNSFLASALRRKKLPIEIGRLNAEQKIILARMLLAEDPSLFPDLLEASKESVNEMINQTRESDADTLNSGPCFIATAVYRSPDSPEVATLRQFRDEVLLQSLLGRFLVRCYYVMAPRFAWLLKPKPAALLRFVLRVVVFDPLIVAIHRHARTKR